MAVESTHQPRTRIRVSALRIAAALAVASAVAFALNAAVAAIAVAAGAPASYAPLTAPVFGAFTVLGVLGGWIGWWLVTLKASRPRAVLAWLAPLVLVLSFIPDVVLLVLKFIPGTTTAAALALMAMHVIVFAVAVPVYAWLTRSQR
jgi:hypothetical protein